MGISEALKMRLQDIKALVLDMDGVLVDTEPLHMEAFRRYLKRYQLPHDDAFIFGFIGFSVPDNMRMVFKKFYNSTDEKKISRAIQERDAIYLQLLRETPLKPLPGIEALIEFCQQQNVTLALASSSDWEQINAIFANLKRTSQGKFDPQQIFKAVLSGQDVPKRKPHPGIYNRMLEMLQIKANQAVAIEDSPAGVQSAKAAGLICLALKSKFIAPQKLHEADVLLDSIHDAVKLCALAMESET